MEYDLAQLAINLLIGGALGFLSGMLGIGGGLLAIPLLVLGYGLEQQIAQGTALVLMAPNMVIGFLRYRQRNPITFRMAALLGSGAIAVSYFAALVAARMPAPLLRTLVAVFMMVLAVNMMWRSYVHDNARVRPARAPHWMLPIVGGIGGFCAGFFTIGGGVAVVPILTSLFGFTQTAAQGLALAMLAPSTAVALATYASLGLVNWILAIPLMLGSILSISAGVVVAHRLPERVLRAAFAVMLLISAIMMLLRQA